MQGKLFGGAVNQSDIINKIIPADDLFWSDEENKFVALSSDEIDSIISRCMASAITEENDIMAVINWCTSNRVGEILMRNFLNGTIAIQTVDSDGEPAFVYNPDGNV
ncbi:MAG: hypothetical protein EBX09_08100 [Actinobacteria bacterium]|nr:hypothetical protein [Actinomycetota bacterium]